MTAVPAHGTTHIAPSLCRVVALLSAVCWCWVLRMAAEMPDLSHLTPEEREIIESVVHRQKQEEQKEQEIMRRKQEEVILLEEKIRQRSEQQKKAGVELDATCHICLKTKFADGVGHLCNYCGIRCCARCGGKVTLRSSKVIWVCILCRKKQELLSKSGEWINHGMAAAGSDPSRRSEVSSPCMMSDKRPKLERAHSAVEKENVPLLQRSNSLLRRQYSQQEPSSRKEQEHELTDEYYRTGHDDYYRGGQLEGVSHRTGTGNQSSRSSHHQPPLHQFGPAAVDCKQSLMGGRGGPGAVPVRKHKRPGNTMPPDRLHQQQHQQHQHQHQRISFSSSEEEELRSTSECTSCDEHESEKGDEVLEWNGCLLQGKTQKEVSDIISESKHLPQIELKVSRSILPRRASYGTPTKAKSSSMGLYDLRKDKPYVMVTSPGSPEHLASNPARVLRASKSVSGPNSLHVGGKIQVKLGFDPQSLKLVVTIMAASSLVPRSDGSPRSAYAKVCLLPDTSEKSKRRTKTIMNSTDPKWNQNFSFTTMRRSDLKFKVLQISLWDYDNNPTNQFLGEVLIELGIKKLENLAEWYPLTAHQEITGEGGISIGDYDMEYSGEHLSPPSTLSRQSDSDASDVDDCCSGRRVGADGASISSLGSSISPPPDYDHLDRRKSRRDMSPLQKSYVYGTTIEKKYGYDVSLKQQSVPIRPTTSVSHRSRSAAPTDSPSQHSRSRSKSPTMLSDRRSLSPPDYRYPGGVQSYRQGPSRFLARSATATPTSTPKKRQLPQIPGTMPSSLDERIPYYFDDQTSSVRRRTRQMQPRRIQSRTGGLGRLHHYGGLSDSDIPMQQLRSLTPPHVRGSMMSRGETGDTCDIDDSDSVISSALSTQSEQPRSTIFCDYGASHSRSGSQQSPVMAPTTDSKRAQFSRSLSNADVQTDNITDSGSSGKRRGDSSSLTESAGKSSASGTNSSTSGMGKKSASASQLSATGRKRRLGFGSKGKSSFTVHRSEEVLPGASRPLVKQPSSVSSDGEASQDGERLIIAGQSTEGEVTTFIGKLGPGQKVSRQILGTPYRGDVKIGFNFFVNFMEVTVFEAKDLINVKETKTKLPDTYVKVYLVKGKKCVEKHRTKTIKESLQPKYMEMLKFKSSPAGCLIQVSVWGDYGREKGRKVFMGVAVIYMDSITTSPGSSLTEWYRLFGSSSL
ncbi:regulating synaptic membrane exocytosis protein 2 isoform X9 [Rhopalosiphum maidis]|uniref:regulating synaptic membrane exocytosis protein 2 isoform X9 n=1 Tax=Rhopalosiphum maidis TaxID=43146 RepID=UPI000EFE1F81|nr:regulating synaptic membrane exocytosis protein 2 isoform X9 [Rhopalosiphum maidis]